MYNIILIGTIHSDNGKCNHNELYKILESIKPNVIFDELTCHYFDFYFSDSFEKYFANNILRNRSNPTIPLEVKSVKKYKQYNNVKVLPVDIDVTSKLSKHKEEILFMFRTFFKYDDYIKLDKEKEILIGQEGFNYINSDVFLDFLIRKEQLEKNIMESEVEKDRLLNIYNLFHAEQCENRENEMLKNIYNYSKENQFAQGVFLIGAEHKKSILKKIIEYEKLSKIKLNWKMYGQKTYR